MTDSQPCSKCQCKIFWDNTIPTPDTAKRFKDGKKNGWWREDASKDVHSAGRCLTLVESKEFMIKGEITAAENLLSPFSPAQKKSWSKEAPDIKIIAQTDVDKKVLEKIEQDAYHETHLILAAYKGCVKACIECGLKEVQGIGLIFKVLRNVE